MENDILTKNKFSSFFSDTNQIKVNVNLILGVKRSVIITGIYEIFYLVIT